jgi:hypothetical protein
MTEQLNPATDGIEFYRKGNRFHFNGMELRLPEEDARDYPFRCRGAMLNDHIIYGGAQCGIFVGLIDRMAIQTAFLTFTSEEYPDLFAEGNTDGDLILAAAEVLFNEHAGDDLSAFMLDVPRRMLIDFAPAGQPQLKAQLNVHLAHRPDAIDRFLDVLGARKLVGLDEDDFGEMPRPLR